MKHIHLVPDNPSRVPLIRVYSHVRSGANWLMAMLQSNYYTDQHRGRAVHRGGQVEFRSYGGEHAVYSPWHGLHAGHDFSPPRDQSFEQFLYIFRDGRSVIASLYDFCQPDVSFGEYLRSPLGWYEFTSNERPGPDQLTPVEHWYLSTRSWIQRRSEINAVRYEDLLRNPTIELLRIERLTRLPHPEDPYDLQREHLVGFLPVGAPPFRNTLDRWREYFGPSELDYFFSIVPEDYECLHRMNLSPTG